MSLLDHLWDETVAGPQPDSGLGKLRKLSSFPQTGSSSWSPSAPVLTRSLTFLRPATSPNGFHGDPGTGSVPGSPASVPSSPSPLSPSTPTSASTPSDWRSGRRKNRAMAESGDAIVQPRSPTVYDWLCSFLYSS